MELAAEDLIDDPVVAPVGYNRFGRRELSCAEGEALYIERGEGGGDGGRHGGSTKFRRTLAGS